LIEESNSGPDSSSRLHLDAEGRQEMLEVIDEESDRLNHFIEGLVELARLEAGNLELKQQWGAVDEMIAMAVDRAEPFARPHSCH
jgi:K+-sensing histidine kinase KdpD